MSGAIDKDAFPCMAASHTKVWRNLDGFYVCGTCHPPAPGLDVVLETHPSAAASDGAAIAADAPVGLRVYFDGSNEQHLKNPRACGGWFIPEQDEFGSEVRGSRYYDQGPHATNNFAEYNAALDALRAAWKAGWRGPVLLHGDSQLVVNHFNGVWRCRTPILQGLLEQLRKAAGHFEQVTAVWIPRKFNREADEQSRLAYDAIRQEMTQPG